MLVVSVRMVARYAPPVSYNFLNLIRLGDQKTIFEKVSYKSLKTVGLDKVQLHTQTFVCSCTKEFVSPFVRMVCL